MVARATAHNKARLRACEYSVIVPTYNRAQSLRRCLAALNEQSYPHSDWEVVVVDDGSSDDTTHVLRTTSLRVPLNWATQRNAGPAAARNLGIHMARGRVILFIGDDIMPTRDWLSVHASAHEEYPAATVAVLGFTTWSPDMKITPFMKHLDSQGLQFGYSLLEGREWADYRCFYSSNVSVKRQLLEQVGLFDEEFRYAAIEDTEIGYRLEKAGMRLLYRPQALAYHEHAVTFASARRKMEWCGIGAALFERKHPQAPVPFLEGALAVQRDRFRNWRRWFLYPIACATGNTHIQGNFWSQRLMAAYLRAYQKARKSFAQDMEGHRKL